MLPQLFSSVLQAVLLRTETERNLPAVHDCIRDEGFLHLSCALRMYCVEDEFYERVETMVRRVVKWVDARLIMTQIW